MIVIYFIINCHTNMFLKPKCKSILLSIHSYSVNRLIRSHKYCQTEIIPVHDIWHR